jgi:hypothetical protein
MVKAAAHLKCRTHTHGYLGPCADLGGVMHAISRSVDVLVLTFLFTVLFR